jgi:hypothetical protein
MCEPHSYIIIAVESESMTMREIEGGRHNIYFVSLTDKPYTHTFMCGKEKERIIFFFFSSSSLSLIASIDHKASKKLHVYNNFVYLRLFHMYI